MAQKYYAVRKGRQPGIYRSWPAAQKQVSGYPQAQFKSFTSEADAKAFLAGLSPATAHRTSAKKTPSRQPLKPADIIVYTDGGSRNHGNVAGDHVHATDKAAWAYRIELPDQLVTDSAGEWGATNNRMEIMAFLKALEQLHERGLAGRSIRFVLDSQYVLNAVTKGWLAGWKRRGWKRSNGPLVNAELWQAVDQLIGHFPHLDFNWTKGHATNPGNVFVDHLLNQTMDQMTAGTTATPHSASVQPIHPAPQSTAPASATSAAPADPATVARSVAAIRKMLKDND